MACILLSALPHGTCSSWYTDPQEINSTAVYIFLTSFYSSWCCSSHLSFTAIKYKAILRYIAFVGVQNSKDQLLCCVGIYYTWIRKLFVGQPVLWNLQLFGERLPARDSVISTISMVEIPCRGIFWNSLWNLAILTLEISPTLIHLSMILLMCKRRTFANVPWL